MERLISLNGLNQGAEYIPPPNGVSLTLNGIGSGGNTESKIIISGNLDIKGKDQSKRVYDSNGIAPTLSTMQGGNQEPKVIIVSK